MKSLFKKKIDWEAFVIKMIYALMVLYVVAAFGALNAERTARQSACDDKHGVVIQSKSGEFYCIKEKSIIK